MKIGELQEQDPELRKLEEGDITCLLPKEWNSLLKMDT